jgi:hypothetical protein
MMFTRENLRKFVVNNRARFATRSLRLEKKVYQFFKIRKVKIQKTILFIVGCQRSGTTLLTEIFERDFDTRVYGEFSKLSSKSSIDKIRLKPLHLVKCEIEKNRAPFIILKPLVETQNLPNLLGYFHNSKALWVFRDYRDVTLSNLSRWGFKRGIKDLRPIVENQAQNWRSENVSHETREVIRKFFSEDMNPYDAAALFWFARNRLFFELNLSIHSNVMMCKYEDLVENPRDIMKAIYRFVGIPYPSDRVFAHVHSNSKGRGKSVHISPSIDLLCKGLFEELNEIYKLQGRVLHDP